MSTIVVPRRRKGPLRNGVPLPAFRYIGKVQQTGQGGAGNNPNWRATIPADAAVGDLCLVSIHGIDISVSYAVPAGWTELFDNTTAAQQFPGRGKLLWKYLTAGDLTTTPVFATSGDKWHVDMRVFRNAKLGQTYQDSFLNGTAIFAGDLVAASPGFVVHVLAVTGEGGWGGGLESGGLTVLPTAGAGGVEFHQQNQAGYSAVASQHKAVAAGNTGTVGIDAANARHVRNSARAYTVVIEEKFLAFTDDFNRADGPLGTGAPFTYTLVGSAITVSGNRARLLAFQVESLALIPMTEGGTVSVKLGQASQPSGGVVAAFDAGYNTGYLFFPDPGGSSRYAVARRSDGGNEYVQQGVGPVAVAGDVVGINVAGTTLTFIVNGVTVHTVTSATIGGSYGGLRGYSVDGSAIFWDDLTYTPL